MARLNRPGKSPIKLARFYKRLGTTEPTVVRISLNSTANFGGVVDAPIREANPNTNYATSDFQFNAKFEIGSNNVGDRTNTVIKFGGLTGAGTGNVSNSKLRIFLLSTDSITVNAAVLNVPFDVNAVTWTIRQTGTNWNVAGVYSGTDVSASIAAQAITTAANLGTYVELTGAGLDAYIQNVLNGTTDNGLLLYNNNQVAPAGTSSYVSSEGANLQRPELVFTLTPSSGGSSVTGTSIDGLDVAITNISPVASITGNSVDLIDTSNSSIRPTAAITSASIDLSDVALANITSITAITSAAIDLTDLSNTSLSPVSSISGVSTDQADLSNALISPVQSASISSAVIDLTDIAQASISPSVAITGTSNDLTDIGSASISPISSVGGSSADLRDVSASTISPLTSLTASNNDGADVSNASINATISVTSATVDQLDVSSASISPITSVSGLSGDGQDISDALISPTPTFNNLSGLSADGADSSSALISPINALSGNSTDGADSTTSINLALITNIKVGGDDVPREEYWEKRKPEIKPDNLDRIIRQTYKNIQQQEPVAIKPLETIVELAEVTSLPQQLEPMIAAIKATLQRMEDDEDEELILMLLG